MSLYNFIAFTLAGVICSNDGNVMRWGGEYWGVWVLLTDQQALAVYF